MMVRKVMGGRWEKIGNRLDVRSEGMPLPISLKVRYSVSTTAA